jgi:hypothetical protein
MQWERRKDGDDGSMFLCRHLHKRILQIIRLGFGEFKACEFLVRRKLFRMRVVADTQGLRFINFC